MRNLMWNLVYVKLYMTCLCCSVELLTNMFGSERNKPEIITTCVYHLMSASSLAFVNYHLMSASSLVLACVVSTTFAICQTLKTYGPRKPFYLGNYPILQFTTTISIAFALKLLDELWTEDPFSFSIRLHSTNNCQLLHLMTRNQC